MAYRLLSLTAISGEFPTDQLKPNEFSTYDRTVHFTPLWFPDATDYTIYTQVWDTWTPDGMLSINLSLQSGGRLPALPMQQKTHSKFLHR